MRGKDNQIAMEDTYRLKEILDLVFFMFSLSDLI
jgi:hypothetical protein